MAEGIIVSYKHDRGFGFIRPDDGSDDLYFHCTAQVVRDWLPAPGERVQYEVGENNQGPTAIAIVLVARASGHSDLADEVEVDGIVKWYDENQGYGFIAGPDNADYFVHVSDIEADGYRCLANDEPVRFTAAVAADGRPKALHVRSGPDRVRGAVVEYDPARGFGFIEPADDGVRHFFHFSDILHTKGRETAVVGEEVEYDEATGPKGLIAKRIRRLDPRMPLFRFAAMGPDQNWLDELAYLAEPERWDYRESRESETADPRHDKPILWSYLVYTFARLEEENREAGDKIVLAHQDGREWACFNTGLITPLQEEIFAVFVEDAAASRTGNKRRLAGFRVSSNRELLTIFPQLPKLANYFDDPTVLLYDRRRELHIEVEHVVRDNLHRFPPVARDNEHLARQLLHAAHADTERRVYRNYKTAIPQYYQASVQLLLPLCLERKDRADLALVVARHGEHYRGETVLTLDMAYNNARLLTRPDDEWLKP